MKKDILLIEDNQDDIELTLDAFQQGGNADRLLTFRDGVDALDYLFADKAPAPIPTLILLDINLPRKSGLEVLTELREEPRTQLIPVVMLTSSNREEDQITAYNSGANSYVCKPLDFNRFVEVTEQLVSYWTKTNMAPSNSPIPSHA